MDDRKAAVRGKERLQELILTLEGVERHLHSSNTTPPTVEEYRLYGLIIRHVRLYILLFYVEKGSSAYKWLSREKLMEAEENEKEKLLRLPMLVYCGKYSINDISCQSSEEVNLMLSLVWERCDPLLEFLKKTRKQLSKLYNYNTPMRPDKLAAPCGADSKKRKVHEDDVVNFSTVMTITADRAGKAVVGSVQVTKTTREHYLLDILQELEDMGRSRSYSPPNEGEIKHYQELRKRITSCLEYIATKPSWQNHVRQWNLLMKKGQLEEDWSHFCGGPFSYGIAYSPAGYRLLATLDKLPGFLSLIKECRCQFTEICSRLYQKKGVEIETYYVEMEKTEVEEAEGSKLNVKLGKRKRVNEVEHDTPAVKSTSMPGDNGQAIVGSIEVNLKTREQCLHDILRAFAKMEFLWFDTQSLVGEVRLYAQIMEHVTSSIWMFKTQPEHLQTGSAGSEKFSCLVGGDTSGAGYGLSDCKTKTREEYLKEIVLLVEAIKSFFLDTPSTASEVVLYEQISTQIKPELLNSNIPRQEQGDAEESKGMNYFSPTDMLKSLLRVVYDWELKLFKEVEEDYTLMVESIFRPMLLADAVVVDQLKWVDNCYNDYGLRENAIDKLQKLIFSLPRGFELLDRLILILFKIDGMFEDFFGSLMAANSYIDSLLGEKKDLQVAHEVSTSLEVLKLYLYSPLPCRSCWGRC